MNATNRSCLVAAILFFVSACATHRAYEDELSYWEGKPAEQLMKHWGVPAKVSTLDDGGRLYLFVKRNEEKLNVKRAPGSEKVVPLYDCKTSFLANRDGLVTAWKYEGHACRDQSKK